MKCLVFIPIFTLTSGRELRCRGGCFEDQEDAERWAVEYSASQPRVQAWRVEQEQVVGSMMGRGVDNG